MTNTGANGDGSKNDPKARHRDRMRRWVRAAKARGRCRCGRRIADGSVSRCPLHLELERLAARRRRGIMTAGQRHRGRPLIGGLAERRREIERDERRREWRRLRQAERQRQRRRLRYL